MNVGELREIIKTMPNEADIIIQHPTNPLEEIKINSVENFITVEKKHLLFITTKWNFEKR